MQVPWQDVYDQARRDFFFILPEAMLAFFGLAILILDFFLTKKEKSWNSLPAMLGVAFSGSALLVMYKGMQGGQAYAFGNSIIIDPFFIFFGFIFLASTALTILISVKYMEIEKEQHGEYYALMLFATVGMMFLACGNDLIVLFVALETMALSFYVLTGFLRRSTRYGHGDVLTILALGTVAAGVFFKIAAVPFHQWAPDVYEGAPTPISAYVSVASKAASFALLLRLFLTVFWPVNLDWVVVMEAVAVLSLTVGTLAAITQSNIKRLLAYSSITQVGYILLGLVAAVNPDGTLHARGLQAMAFYLFVYAFFNTGAFAIIILLRHRGVIGDDIDDLNGLIQRNPGAAVVMLIFLLSLAGIPPTAGFFAKLLVFWALIETGHTYLAVLSVLYILPAVYYYFRLVAAMWVKESTDPVLPVISLAQKFALAAMVLVTLAAGIFPEQFLRLATYSILIPFGR
jgi:NADH-quinone oxidoreductase subunit N